MMPRFVSVLRWWVLGLPFAAAACNDNVPPHGVDAAAEDDIEERAQRNYGKCNPRCPVGQVCCNGSCSALNEASFCGSCEKSCGTASTCNNGVCSCNFEDEVPCPVGDPAVGSTRCTNLNEDMHCGQCGELCLWGNCNNGDCTCPNGRTTCHEPGGIVCAITGSNFRHCGGCNAWCKGSACAGGECVCPEGKSACTVPAASSAGLAALDGDLTPIELAEFAAYFGQENGPAGTVTYCSDMQNDPENCGACGLRCESGACANGVCVPCANTSCAGPGGIECVDTNTDRENCGVCGLTCQAFSHCVQGVCTCDPDRPDLCQYNGALCTKKAEDPNNCGQCGVVCMPGAECSEGSCDCPNPGTTPQNCNCKECDTNETCVHTIQGRRCQACEPYETVCNNECRELASDRGNCGACGTICNDNQICEQGVCTACAPGRTRCLNRCLDLQTDRLNCGACFHICGPTEICAGGLCVPEAAAETGTGETGGSGAPDLGGWTLDPSGGSWSPDMGGWTFDPSGGSGSPDMGGWTLDPSGPTSPADMGSGGDGCTDCHE